MSKRARRRGKMAVQKLMGAALLLMAYCGLVSQSNIAVVLCAIVLGIVFLFSRKIIFEL